MKKRLFDNLSSDVTRIDTSEDVLSPGIVITSMVLDAISKLASLSTSSLGVTIVPKTSAGYWAPINKVKNDRVLPSKMPYKFFDCSSNLSELNPR